MAHGSRACTAVGCNLPGPLDLFHVFLLCAAPSSVSKRALFVASLARFAVHLFARRPLRRADP
jgi:hypothetical protein